MSTTLKDLLSDWQEDDFAMESLAKCLGLVPADYEYYQTKWVYWVRNVLGDFLGRTLDDLVALGVLEWDEDGRRYRLRPDFEPPLTAEQVAASTLNAPRVTAVTLGCADLQRSKLFYERLGLEFAEHPVVPHAYLSSRRGATVAVELRSRENETPAIGFGLGVRDVHELLAGVEQSGGSVIRVVKWSGGAGIFFAVVSDPDGNNIKLSHG